MLIIYTSEERLTEITRKAYDWTGASIGASTFAGADAVGGQLGSQVLVPEDIITVPLAGLIGGIVGYFVGETTHDVVKECVIEPGVNYLENKINSK